MAQDLRKVLRLLAGRHTEPSAVILDGRTLHSTPESGARAGYDGHKHKKGSKVHAAVDTLGHLLALKVTAANEQERAENEIPDRSNLAFLSTPLADMPFLLTAICVAAVPIASEVKG